MGWFLLLVFQNYYLRTANQDDWYLTDIYEAMEFCLANKSFRNVLIEGSMGHSKEK